MVIRKLWRFISGVSKDIWWGLEARICGLHHLLRGHDLEWREKPSLWIGDTGSITCHKCPDSSIGNDGEHVGLWIWSRWSPWLMQLGRILCGLIGHPSFGHPQQCVSFARRDGVRHSIPEGESIFNDPVVYLLDEWFCKRCCYSYSLKERDKEDDDEPR